MTSCHDSPSFYDHEYTSFSMDHQANFSDLVLDVETRFHNRNTKENYINCYNFYNSRLIFFVLDRAITNTASLHNAAKYERTDLWQLIGASLLNSAILRRSSFLPEVTITHVIIQTIQSSNSFTDFLEIRSNMTRQSQWTQYRSIFTQEIVTARITHQSFTCITWFHPRHGNWWHLKTVVYHWCKVFYKLFCFFFQMFIGRLVHWLHHDGWQSLRHHPQTRNRTREADAGLSCRWCHLRWWEIYVSICHVGGKMGNHRK